MRPRGTAAVGLVALLAFGAGCAENFAQQSTHGALRAVKESNKPAVIMERATRAGAIGAFEELTAEERRAALTELSRDVATAAARGMHTELTEAIGAGNGPLAQAMATTAQRIGTSMIFPECGEGANRAACIHAQLEALTQTTATGLARAVREQLELPALVVAFVAGVLSTLFVLFVVSTLRTRHELPLRRPAQPA